MRSFGRKDIKKNNGLRASIVRTCNRQNQNLSLGKTRSKKFERPSVVRKSKWLYR